MRAALARPLFATAVLCACDASAHRPLPDSWDLDEIAVRAMSNERQCFTDYQSFDLRSAQPIVLAWRREVDERPLELETCFLVVRGKDAQARDAWLLAALGRHSHDVDPQWRVSWVSHDETPGRSLSSAPPKREELEAFIRHWDRCSDPSEWRALGADLCESGWSIACGAAPSDEFRRAWANHCAPDASPRR